MQGTSSLLSVSNEGSPSFNTYSSSGGKLSEIAARVVQQFKNETDRDDSERCKQPELDNHDDNNDGKSDGEFEFSIVCREEESIPIAADDIFYNGQIKPVYPLFNTDLLSNSLCAINEESTTMKTKETSYQHPLRQLFSEERELTYTTCSSSEEADELDGLEPGTYCVWRPKKAGESLPSPSDKITGSSKRWKFRNLCIGATATARTRSCS